MIYSKEFKIFKYVVCKSWGINWDIWRKNDYLAKKKLSKFVSKKVEKLDKKISEKRRVDLIFTIYKSFFIDDFYIILK